MNQYKKQQNLVTKLNHEKSLSIFEIFNHLKILILFGINVGRIFSNNHAHGD